MSQVTLSRNHAVTLTAYLTPQHRILDAAHRVIGTYRWLTTGRIVALIGGKLYAGEVAHA